MAQQYTISMIRDSLTVVELKEIAGELGVVKSGKKADLIDRIKNHLRTRESSKSPRKKSKSPVKKKSPKRKSKSPKTSRTPRKRSPKRVVSSEQKTYQPSNRRVQRAPGATFNFGQLFSSFEKEFSYIDDQHIVFDSPTLQNGSFIGLKDEKYREAKFDYHKGILLIKDEDDEVHEVELEMRFK
jgi:hypothetical protein